MEVEEKKAPIFRDIRRHYCEYCGICRSKKSLITSHLLSHHKEEVEEKLVDVNEEREGDKSNTCQQCGTSFRKLAYLKQHMQSHSLEHWIPCKELQNAKRQHSFTLNGPVPGWGTSCEAPSSKPQITHVSLCKRPFTCPVDNCSSSYRRKDHLTRHLLQHQGKLFTCPIEDCNRRFAFHGNMTRHVKELHDEDKSPSCDGESQKQHVCQEIGCGKVFKFASKLRKHQDSHVKLDSVEAICCECMKHFTNSECLKAHLQSCHQYVPCEVCGVKQLKKNIKRHLRTHEAGHVSDSEKFKCSFKDCRHTFSTKSNLNQHNKAVHLELRPFACRFPGCDQSFPYRHVRDNHEKTGTHVYAHGDFEESDAQFQSRPRGGRKRKCPTVETLLRKRVVPPNQTDSILNRGTEYLAWLLSEGAEENQQ